MDDNIMEHPRIDDEAILDRYVAGRLSDADEVSFEEHLFECATCLERVQVADELRRGLRVVAAEDAARATVAVGLLAWWRGQGTARKMGLGALALVLALLPAALLWQQAELRGLRARSALVATGDALTRPLSALQVVSLGVVRGAEDAEATTTVRVDPAQEGVMLSLELPPSSADRYRVTILDDDGAERWLGDDLVPNLYDTLVIVLPSSFLAPGRYRMTIEAQAPDGVRPVGDLFVRLVD